jgi:hypothetical protein
MACGFACCPCNHVVDFCERRLRRGPNFTMGLDEGATSGSMKVKGFADHGRVAAVLGGGS